MKTYDIVRVFDKRTKIKCKCGNIYNVKHKNTISVSLKFASMNKFNIKARVEKLKFNQIKTLYISLCENGIIDPHLLVKIVDNHDIIGIDAKHLWNNSENFKSIKINKSIEL